MTPPRVTAEPYLPEHLDLDSLRTAARVCHGCPLYENATQTVFGEGPARAKVVMVGEQPGDREDQEGRPFVGPAGRLLDELMEEAGIDRRTVYVTNAVKHFKWVARGKRRIHATPTAGEVAACRPWLEAEIAVVHPRVIVALGATAAKALLGPSFRVTQSRGEFYPWPQGGEVVATIHPSALLRIEDAAEKQAERHQLIEDLAAIPRRLAA